MSGFGGYGSAEFRLFVGGALVGFFVGFPYSGLRGGLIGAAVGSIGLFATFLLILFFCWGIDKIVARIKRIKRRGSP